MTGRIVTLLALSACLHAAALMADEPANRPNILLITADDLGNQLSCYGDTRLATPHLDALAAAGVRFTRAYVTQSSCSSSRSSILTGLYPHQNGQYGLAHLGFRMHAGQKNLVAMLKASGYRHRPDRQAARRTGPGVSLRLAAIAQQRRADSSRPLGSRAKPRVLRVSQAIGAAVLLLRQLLRPARTVHA